MLEIEADGYLNRDVCLNGALHLATDVSAVPDGILDTFNVASLAVSTKTVTNLTMRARMAEKLR